MNDPSKNNLSPGAEMIPKGISVFAQLIKSAKKALRPSANAEDFTLANGLAAVHIEQTRIMSRLGRFANDEPINNNLEHDQGTLPDTQRDSDPSEGQDPSPLAAQETPIQSNSSTPTTNAVDGPAVLSFVSIEKALPSLPATQQQYHAIFPHNVAKPFFRTPLPKLGNRFSSTLQLAFANHLSSKKVSPSTPAPGLVVTAEYGKLILADDERAWMRAMNKDPTEQDRICWLAAQVVSEFLKTTHKDADSIAEVVLLGLVLDRKAYRGALSSLIGQLEREPLLDIDLLQGLVQFLQSASPGYLIDDDLVRILRVLQRRLKDTHEQLGDANQPASAHIHQLTNAVSRVLDVMVEGNIKGLNRTEDHRPLLDILAGLNESPDPYLEFQASYAYQALQYVGDDESPLHMALRVGGGVVMAAASAASIFKLDLESLFNGLRELGQAAGQAFDVAKAGIEGTQALRADGEGVMDSLLKGFRSGTRRAWYPALQGARIFIREGRLADFKRVVYEAPCRREREFQWGVCQLLGEIAMDPAWDTETRQQAVDFLEKLRRDDAHCRDSSVYTAIVGVLRHVSEDAEQIVQCHAASILQDLTSASVDPPMPYPLRTRLPLPTTSPLLAKVFKISSMEYELHRVMLQRLEEHHQAVYIPPQAKASLQAKDEDSSSLMERIKTFLGSEQQVFLVLGDSGSGKSTFNRHLERELWGSYNSGDPIPLYINLPSIDNPERDLIPEQLRILDFTEDNIREMKRDRQFILICDGYDERQLMTNLHTSNLLNRRGQWNTKMVITCRSTYLDQVYRIRFQPQPIDRYDPSTEHLFQEAAIVPFSSTQIKEYVEQFVRDKEVHKLFGNYRVWTVEEYMDTLAQVPNLLSMVKNPFLLILSLRALPTLVHDKLDLTETKVTRKRIYETFVKQWLETNMIRLNSIKLSLDATVTLQELTGIDFVKIAVEFLQELAMAIFKWQDGNHVVQYIHRDDKEKWKAKFFGPDTKATLLRDASPMTRAGNLHRFIHRSLLEYFYTFEKHEIHQFKNMRLREYATLRQTAYVPPFAKASPQADDCDLFPLMEKVREFLQIDRQVFLITGDSGAGKSTFNRRLEYELLMSYQQGDSIPLYINLPSIDDPHKDLIPKALRHYNFSEDVIQELREHHSFTLICDGYDESQLRRNLHTTNNFNRPGQWRVKMIISCRSYYLGQDYRDQFQPQWIDRYSRTPMDHYSEAAIAPFTRDQIEKYVEQFVRDPEVHELFDGRPVWSTEEYMDKLLAIPNLMELVKNPFLLTLSLKVLPNIVYNADSTPKDVKKIRVTRVSLYDEYVYQWLEVNRRLLINSQGLSKEARDALDELLDEGYTDTAFDYLESLAAAIFREQQGYPIVRYIHQSDNNTWKARFFDPDSNITLLLRGSSPLISEGSLHQFIHRSLLEYFYSRTICNPVDYETDAASGDLFSTVNLKIGLARMNIVGEPSILQFLVERVNMNAWFKAQLLDAVDDSKTDAEAGVAAANAISILVRAGCRFNGADLRGIRIPGADLRGGQFDSADFVGANLTNAHLGKAWLRQANLSMAIMSGVQFGELPYLDQEHEVARCAYSSDGKLLVVSSMDYDSVAIYDTASWSKIASGPDGYAIAISPNGQELAVGRMNNTVELSDILSGWQRLVLTGHTQWVTCVSYSPDGRQIATSSSDSTVRIWSTVSGETVHVLSKHTYEVHGVAFSPSGLQLVSSSRDGTVRTWDAKSGELLATMEAHSGDINFVTYSPDGDQIASCDNDGSVRLWDARTYEICHVLSGHRSYVLWVAYSPDGRQLASCGYDNTIRLWDPHTGESSGILFGHTGRVNSVVFSPTGDYLASGSSDRIVRLWKTGGDSVDVSLRADVHRFRCIDASPCGSWIVTGSDDGSVRLWESLTGQPGAVMEGHFHTVWKVAYSPCGKRIASASSDNTVRLWDIQAGTALRVFEGHTDSVHSVAFSPNGHQIVSGSLDKTVRTWDTQTGQPGFTLEGHTDWVIGVVYSPIGHQIASWSYDNTVRLWCSQIGVQQHVLSLDYRAYQVVYSPDGQYLVSIRSWWEGPQKPSYWDPESGQPVRRLDEVDIETELCSFSPDGKHIAIQHGELLRLWDVESDKELHVRGSWIGRSQEVKWIPGPGCLCLVTITDDSLLVWKLVAEKDELNSLVLCWRTGMNKLTVGLANLDGAVGLSSANLALMKQRGTVIKNTDE